MVNVSKDIEQVSIEKLIPYAKNSRTHSDAQVAQVSSSIKEFGFTNPVLIDQDGVIIAGHGRVLAARKLGMSDVPCIRLTHLSDTQKRAYVIADNKLALNAGWDAKLLEIELRDLQEFGFDLGMTGFDADEIADLFSNGEKTGLVDPDLVPDTQALAISKLGDVWQCGSHRVVCGDSTSADDYKKLMAGIIADACWTDPPYNVNYESKKTGKIKNDNMQDDAFLMFLRSAFTNLLNFLKPGSSVYIAHADTEGYNFRSAFREAGFKLSGCLVWVKDSLVLGRSDYQWQHEPILYGWKPGASHRWFGGRKQTTLLKEDSSVFVKNLDGTITVNIGSESMVIAGDNLSATAVDSSVIRCEKPKRSLDHPTMKPVELINRMLTNSTRGGDVVLDIFGGSGSTMISCEMLGRQARLIELDARFVDVIVKRWQNFTGGGRDTGRRWSHL